MLKSSSYIVATYPNDAASSVGGVEKGSSPKGRGAPQIRTAFCCIVGNPGHFSRSSTVGYTHNKNQLVLSGLSFSVLKHVEICHYKRTMKKQCCKREEETGSHRRYKDSHKKVHFKDIADLPSFATKTKVLILQARDE